MKEIAQSCLGGTSLFSYTRDRCIHWIRERIKSLNADNEVTPEIFIDCLKQGDLNAIPIATELRTILSIGLGNAVDILNPDAVVLNGG